MQCLAGNVHRMQCALIISFYESLQKREGHGCKMMSVTENPGTAVRKKKAQILGRPHHLRSNKPYDFAIAGDFCSQWVLALFVLENN